jgi:hypothetical protein
MPHRALETARQLLGLSVLELWWTYFALGGVGDAFVLESYLSGRSAGPTTVTHNAIVQALNEAFADRGQDRLLPFLGD